MAVKSKIRNFESEIQSFEKDGDTYIKFISVTDKFINLDQLKSIDKYAINQPVTYRHQHPIKGEGGSITGRVTSSDVVDYKVVKYVKGKDEANDPIQISIGFEEFYDKRGDPSDAQIYEFTLTHNPMDWDTTTEGVYTMPTKQEMESKEKENEDLRKELDLMSGKAKEFEDELGEVKSELEEEKAKVVEFEALVLTSKDELKEFKTKLKEFEDKMHQAEIKHIVDQIFEIEKDEDLVPVYETWSENKLMERLAKKKKSNPNPIVTETLKESQRKVMEADELKVNLDNLTPEMKDIYKRAGMMVE